MLVPLCLFRTRLFRIIRAFEVISVSLGLDSTPIFRNLITQLTDKQQPVSGDSVTILQAKQILKSSSRKSFQ